MNREQREQIERQLSAHLHEDYQVDLELTENVILQDFQVHKDVFRADITLPRYFARWLFFNQDLYQSKKILEIGSGTGILGIVMALHGAEQVDFTDLFVPAVENTRANLKQYGLEGKVLQGDLFEPIDDQYDIVLFNHPFFPGEPDERVVSHSMLGGTKLFPRSLEEAKSCLSDPGIFLTSYWDFAGPENHPKIQGPKQGYQVNKKFTLGVGTGLQKGELGIYVLER